MIEDGRTTVDGYVVKGDSGAFILSDPERQEPCAALVDMGNGTWRVCTEFDEPRLLRPPGGIAKPWLWVAQRVTGEWLLDETVPRGPLDALCAALRRGAPLLAVTRARAMELGTPAALGVLLDVACRGDPQRIDWDGDAETFVWASGPRGGAKLPPDV